MLVFMSKGFRVWMGVGRPCPPVRNDIVTARRLLSFSPSPSTALNMATKNLSVELGRGSKKVTCLAVHPGTVDTDLSRPYHRNVAEGKLFSVQYSVDCMMNIVENVSISDSGKYLGWDGKEIPY